MAIPIKETPVLYGNDAKRFLQEVAQNEKRSHRAEFARIEATCSRLNWKGAPTCHAEKSR